MEAVAQFSYGHRYKKRGKFVIGFLGNFKSSNFSLYFGLSKTVIFFFFAEFNFDQKLKRNFRGASWFFIHQRYKLTYSTHFGLQKQFEKQILETARGTTFLQLAHMNQKPHYLFPRGQIFYYPYKNMGIIESMLMREGFLYLVVYLSICWLVFQFVSNPLTKRKTIVT